MRVLIVDDETLAQDRLTRMLETDGRHEVVAGVSNGIAALERCTQLNRMQLSVLRAANDTRRIHLCARTYKGMRLINVADIRYLQADQKYITVRDEHQEVIVDETLRELEEEFADLFIRVHLNALVARKHIVGLEKDVSGQIVMRLDSVPETVEISRRHLPAVRKILKNI